MLIGEEITMDHVIWQKAKKHHHSTDYAVRLTYSENETRKTRRLVLGFGDKFDTSEFKRADVGFDLLGKTPRIWLRFYKSEEVGEYALSRGHEGKDKVPRIQVTLGEGDAFLVHDCFLNGVYDINPFTGGDWIFYIEAGGPEVQA